MTTKTTMHLRMPRPRIELQPPVAAAIVIFCLLAIAGLVGRIQSAGSAAAVPTPGLIILIATRQAETPPTAVPIQVAAVVPNVRWVVGFDSPNGRALGAIPAPDGGAIVARYGDSWYMVEWNGGPVWIRAADLGLHIADLAPDRVVYVPVQGPPAPAYAAQPVEAAPTPAAAVYEALSERQAIAPQQLVILDRQQWAEQQRQRNIQNRLVEPQYPPIAPMEMNPVNAEWARQQGCVEHPEWHC